MRRPDLSAWPAGRRSPALWIGFTRLSRDKIRMQEKVEYALMVIAKVAERVAKEDRAKPDGGDGDFPSSSRRRRPKRM